MKMTVSQFRTFLKKKKPKKKKSNDSKLWKVFSEYIRLKYSSENGYCTCYTCGAIRFFRNCDAGHGIGRQFKATKFEEINVRPQCKPCNGFNGGKREVFKEKMDKEHGAGTWEKLELRARQRFSYSDFKIGELIKFYSEEVKRLKKEKGL